MGAIYSRSEIKKGIWDDDLNLHPESSYSFIYKNYFCSIVRNSSSWTYCGYVQLPIEHPDFYKNYFDLEAIINVHGQLTFSDNGKFGFDCCHYNDFSPTLGAIKDGHYWTFDEVKKEIEKMVDQFEKRQNV